MSHGRFLALHLAMFGFVCRVSAEMIFLRLRYRGNHFPLNWFTADLFPLGCVYVEIIFPRLSQPGKWLSASTLSEPKETKSNFSLCINYIYKHFRSILSAPYGLGVYAKNKKKYLLLVYLYNHYKSDKSTKKIVLCALSPTWWLPICDTLSAFYRRLF